MSSAHRPRRPISDQPGVIAPRSTSLHPCVCPSPLDEPRPYIVGNLDASALCCSSVTSPDSGRTLNGIPGLTLDLVHYLRCWGISTDSVTSIKSCSTMLRPCEMKSHQWGHCLGVTLSSLLLRDMLSFIAPWHQQEKTEVFFMHSFFLYRHLLCVYSLYIRKRDFLSLGISLRRTQYT